MTTTINEVKKFWDDRPCNIRHSSKELGTIEYFDEVSRTEDSRIKQALASLHSRLSETDKENAYKWSAYYRGLVDGEL